MPGSRSGHRRARPAAAVGEVTVTVRSKPDPTDAPVAVADRVLGGTARVDWRPPAYDGGCRSSSTRSGSTDPVGRPGRARRRHAPSPA